MLKNAECLANYKRIISWVSKTITNFGWGKGEKVTTAGWQVTLCNPIWHVICLNSGDFDYDLLYPIYFTFMGFIRFPVLLREGCRFGPSTPYVSNWVKVACSEQGTEWEQIRPWRYESTTRPVQTTKIHSLLLHGQNNETQ